MVEELRVSDFATDGHRAIFASIVALTERSQPVDPITVGVDLGEKVSHVGGKEYLHTLVTACPAFSAARDYARAVRSSAIDRATESLYGQIKGKGLHGSELLGALQEGLYQLDRQETPGADMSDALARLLKDSESPPPRDTVCAYPWGKVEWLTKGLRKGTFNVLAGQPGHGKSAAALAIVRHNLKRGRRVLFVSMEMDEMELAIRAAQSDGFNSDAYWQRRVSEDNIAALQRMLKAEHWKRLRVETVERQAQLFPLIRRHKPDLLVFDYLQLLDTEDSNRTEALTKQTRLFKMMSRRYHLPVLCLSQMSRKKFEDDSDVTLERLRGSGTIGADADTVIYVRRERDRESGELGVDGAFHVVKVRMGPTGKMAFHFEGETQTFHEIDYDHEGI
jgi:replicative DNA helicase